MLSQLMTPHSNTSSTSKKAGSKSAAAEENRILEHHIKLNHVEYNKSVLVGVGIGTAFLPAYLAHATFLLEWTTLSNVPFYLLVPAVTAVMLAKAYGAMVESEFWKRQRHYTEVSGATDQALLRRLRIQTAIGYAIFFTNACFLSLATVLQGYIFRSVDARASYFLSSTLAAAFMWLLAQKNEESRLRRMRGGAKAQ